MGKYTIVTFDDMNKHYLNLTTECPGKSYPH